MNVKATHWQLVIFTTQSFSSRRNVRLVIPAMLGSLVDQALPVDEVSRPTDEERKDYDAMTLKEKNAFGSAWFA